MRVHPPTMWKTKNTAVYDAESLQPTSSINDTDSFDGSLSRSTSGSRLYQVYHTMLRHDYNVTAADKTPLFHVHNSMITPKRPDLTVHAGVDEKAPILAACKFLHFSRHFKVCIGDPQDVGSARWEDLVCQSMRLNKYRWQMSIQTAAGSERRSFVWKSTHHVGVGDEKPSIFNSRSWKLVEEQTERIVAVFMAKNLTSLKKSGKLEVVVDYGQEFDLMALLTVLALYEKQRRRSNSGSGGGGGGGGG